MYHVPIVDTKNHKQQIEFCHINKFQPTGAWKKEDAICLDNIKINFLMRGEFSVISENKILNPVFGDMLVFAAQSVHYGHIAKPTHTDYYQLDIGLEAFGGIPQGNRLLEILSANSREIDTFLRPDTKSQNRLLQLFERVEMGLREKNYALAFVHVVEIVSKINELYVNDNGIATQSLSKYVSMVINYIEKYYAEPIKIDTLAEFCGVSTSFLSRQFKKEVGVGIHSYLNNHRIVQSTYLLAENTVAQTAMACGFSDSAHYIATFKKKFGYTPTEFLKRI